MLSKRPKESKLISIERYRGQIIKCMVITTVTTADCRRDDLKALLSREVQRLKKLWVDSGYRSETLKANRPSEQSETLTLPEK